MSKISVAVGALINAPADTVYDIIADYEHAHQSILPPENFQNLRVEKGGRGAGTVISFVSISPGRKQPMKMVISEPEPGRVLVELDPASSLVTTFTVTPVEAGEKANVEIRTELEPSNGPMGLLERLLVPATLRRIYEKELTLLEEVAARVGARM